MSEAKKKASAPKTKPDAAVLEDVKAQVMSQIEANQTVDTLPHGAQAGLFGPEGREKLKKLVGKIVPALLEGTMMVADGQLSADEIRTLVERGVTLIQGILADRKAATDAGRVA